MLELLLETRRRISAVSAAFVCPSSSSSSSSSSSRKRMFGFKHQDNTEEKTLLS
jgi:hypothetical protein